MADNLVAHNLEVGHFSRSRFALGPVLECVNRSETDSVWPCDQLVLLPLDPLRNANLHVQPFDPSRLFGSIERRNTDPLHFSSRCVYSSGQRRYFFLSIPC